MGGHQSSLFAGHWAYSPLAPPQYFHQAQILFCFYFFMTGIHALHMIVGVGLMTTIFVDGAQGNVQPELLHAGRRSGLYWHFVDIVWIFLFPLAVSDRTHQKPISNYASSTPSSHLRSDLAHADHHDFRHFLLSPKSIWASGTSWWRS